MTGTESGDSISLKALDLSESKVVTVGLQQQDADDSQSNETEDANQTQQAEEQSQEGS